MNDECRRQFLASHMLPTRCAICRKLLPSCYDTQGYDLDGFYFSVGCVRDCHQNCFARGYMIQGVQIKFVPAFTEGYVLG